VNAAIRERSQHRADLHYVDVVPAMLENGQPRAIYRDDALHMNEAGYRIWTGILKPMLEANAAAEQASCARLLRDEGIAPVPASP
jgi:lysophospholipase L1-like esterase